MTSRLSASYYQLFPLRTTTGIMTPEGTTKSELLDGTYLDHIGCLPPKKYDRAHADTIVDGDRFMSSDLEYSHQYFELYKSRLRDLKPRILTAAKRKWAEYNPHFAERMIDLEQDKLSVIVGTIYISNKLKPRALDEVNKDEWPLQDPPSTKIARYSDPIVLEDDTGRIELSIEESILRLLVTGMVAGILGVESATGIFAVRDTCFTETAVSQLPDALTKVGCNEQSKYVAFISGIKASTLKYPHGLYSLIDFLNGSSGCEMIQKFSSRIVEVIIAGNVLQEKPNSSQVLKGLSLHSRMHNTCKERLADMDLVDDILQRLGKTINVDVLPGESDPAAPALPQRPLNPCMFPLSSKMPTVNFLSNPASLYVDGVSILGTSGQNIDDIYRCSLLDSRIQMAHLTLLCSHIAPTAPDTLWCRPLAQRDKLILDTWPNIYFIGNQPSFEYELIQLSNSKTLILLIPSFRETSTMILVNLTTLKPIAITFPKYST